MIRGGIRKRLKMLKKHKEMLEKVNRLKPVLNIGKNGITENALKDLKNYLKKRKLIKVKLLRSFIEGKDRKKMAKEIAEKTDSEIIKQIGFVVVLYKK